MINVFGSLVGKEELDEIRTSLEAQWMGIGPKTAAFEKDFARRLGLPEFVLLDSGSNALHMAVKLLDLPAGSEVVVPSFTWISCAHAVVLSGCVPVFCDVDLDTHNVTAELAAKAVTKKTGAIMLVHYGGLPVAVEEVAKLGLPIIEDAAHAVDSRRKGAACGGLGEVGSTARRGQEPVWAKAGLTAKDPARVARARQLRYGGIGKSGFEPAKKDRWWEYNVTDFFPKMLPSDISASIGLAQLRKLDAMQAYRKRIWELYQKEFASLAWLKRPQDAPAGDRHSYFTYCISINGGRRDALAKFLLQEGVYTTLRYHPLHMNPIYGSKAHLPNCERLNEEALSIPLHPGLKEADVEKVIASVKKFKA